MTAPLAPDMSAPDLSDEQTISVLVSMWLETHADLEAERARNADARRLAAQLGLVLEGATGLFG